MKHITEPAEWIFQGNQQKIFSIWYQKTTKLVDLLQAPIQLSRDSLYQFYQLILNALMGSDTADIYFFLQKQFIRLIHHGLSFHATQAALSDLRTLMLDLIINHPDLDASSRSYWISQILELFDTIQNHIQKFYFEQKHQHQRDLFAASFFKKLPAVFFSLEGGRFSRRGYLSPTFEQWTGINASDFLQHHSWQDVISQNDFEQFQSAFHYWQNVLMPFYSIQYRFSPPNGRQKTVLEIGRIEYTRDGSILHVHGFFFEYSPLLTSISETDFQDFLKKLDIPFIQFNTQEIVIQNYLPKFLNKHSSQNNQELKSWLPLAIYEKIHQALSTTISKAIQLPVFEGNTGKYRPVLLPSPAREPDQTQFFLILLPQPTPERSTANRMEHLSQFQLKSLAIEEEQTLYAETITALKQIFPQADGGSILVLKEAGFQFVEVFNYDLNHLSKIVLLDPLDPNTQRHSLQLQAIHNASKVITIEDIKKQARQLLPPRAYQILRKYGRLDQIKVTLSGLVKVDGHPAAIINVDSFTDSNAFTTIDEKMMDILVQTLSGTLKRLQILQNLRLSEANYRQLFERSPMAIYIHQDDRFKLFNPKFLEYLGISAEEAQNMNIWDLVHPDDLPTLKKRAMARLRGEKPLSEYEFRVITPEGEILNVLGSFTRVTYNGQPAILGEVMNITRLKKLEKQIAQAQRMETIGRFTAGIAHDFNNILGAIMPGAELIQENPTAEDNKNRAKIILNMARRGAELTQQLLSFARQGMVHKQSIDLRQFIEKNKTILLNSVRPAVQIQFKIPETLPPIEGDPSQLLQLLLNLVINANDAIPDRGTITISLEEKHFRQTRLCTIGVLKPRPYVMLAVKDTGTGIPEEVRDKIFEPFFTSKEPGKGTGLGLSTVYGIVKRHDAALMLYTKLNRGTTFRIYFPATSTSEPPEQQSIFSEPASLPHPEGGHILLVDDEVQLLEIVQVMLKDMGFNVTIARGGKEALRTFKKHSKKFSLIILDYSMPDMSGKEIFAQMKAINPQVPVLIATGYGEELDLRNLKQQGVQGIIPKPFTFQQLQEKIRSVLATE